MHAHHLDIFEVSLLFWLQTGRSDANAFLHRWGFYDGPLILAEAARLVGWKLSSPILVTVVLVQIKQWQCKLPLVYPVNSFQTSPVGRNGRGRWGEEDYRRTHSVVCRPLWEYWHFRGTVSDSCASTSVGPARIWIRICQRVTTYQEEFKTCFPISLILLCP